MNRTFSRLALRNVFWLAPTAIFWFHTIASPVPGQTAAKSTAISSAIIERIQDRWKLSIPNYEVEIRRMPFMAEEFDAAGAFDSITITPLTRKRPRGIFPMLIDIYRDGRSVRHGQASAFIAKFDSVMVADSRASKGTLARDLALQLKFEETTFLQDAYITNSAELDGMRLKRNLQRGDILTRSRLEQIPDVDFGQEVIIEYTGAGLLISAPGYALQKGITGETVRVRNLSSRNIIKAVVAGPGLVRIAAGGGQRRTR